jgi:hypothetical protein
LILYLDSSSLVKLYVEENGSADVERLADEASLFDSLHLASFLYLANANLGEPVQFSSFDNRLIAAAKAEMQPR